MVGAEGGGEMIARILILLCTACVILPGTGQAESGFMDAGGGEIFYEVTGQGPDMVLVHDGLVHGVVWDGQVPFFARDYRVIRYDRRGYGRSPMSQVPYSDLDDLKALFDHFNVSNAVLVGMSAGGRLAIDFTLEYPERVSRLVLVGAVLNGYGFSEHFFTRGGRLRIADYADEEKMRTYWAMEDPYELAPGDHEARENLEEILAANPQNLDFGKAALARAPRRTALGHLDEISVPTLVVVGEFDIPDVHAHAGVIEAGIAGAQRTVVAGAGHLVPFERPDEFNSQVDLFLKEADFLGILETGGTEAALAAVRAAREKDPDAVIYREAKVNLMGYAELQAGNYGGAIDFFLLNVAVYPGSWNAYDSLGEAYAREGATDLAIENYEKSLELNPDNANAEEWLRRLKGD
jgi:3-oxoadipate enol-lactonase